MCGNAVKAMFRAIDARDWPRVSAFYTPDCVYERPGFPPCEGLGALVHFYESVRPIQMGEHIVCHVASEGAYTYASGGFIGMMKDGKRVDLQFSDLYIFDQDKIKLRKTFFFAPLA